MVAVVGTYQNGYVKIDKEYSTNNPVKAIVTFLENMRSQTDKGLSLADFSFPKSQKNLENYKGPFSEGVIEERRANFRNFFLAEGLRTKLSSHQMIKFDLCKGGVDRDLAALQKLLVCKFKPL